jgi:hypothetical protein
MSSGGMFEWKCGGLASDSSSVENSGLCCPSDWAWYLFVCLL